MGISSSSGFPICIMGIVKWVSSSCLTGLGSSKVVIDSRSSMNCKAVYIKGSQIPSFGSLHFTLPNLSQ